MRHRSLILSVMLTVACLATVGHLVIAGEADENPVTGLRGGPGKPSPPPAADKSTGGWPKDYTIVPGDWLSKIAQRFYGSPYLWPLIYRANRDKIGDDPDLIHPNVVLKIPEPNGTVPDAPDPKDNEPTRAGDGTGTGRTTGDGRFNQVLPLHTGTVTSNFGPRSCTGCSTYHQGLDIGAGTGTPVYATGPGKVTNASSSGGYGNLVKIAHRDGTVTYYAHLQGFNTSVGREVLPDQQVARVNNTGSSTGPHLHFGVEKGGYVDPRRYFKFPAKGGSI